MSTPSAHPDAALVARAVLRLGRRLRQARPKSGVTVSGLGLLTTLHREGPMPAVALARAEQLQPQSLSRLISRLEADGLISREPGEADRRTLILAITPEGRRVRRRDMEARRAWLDARIRETLGAEERALLAQAAALMLRVAGDDDA